MQTTSRANDDHLETLTKLNQDYITSVQTSDVRRFEQLLSEDFLNSNPDGSLVNRADFLAQIGRLAAISNLKCEDVRIRVMGLDPQGRPARQPRDWVERFRAIEAKGNS